MSKTTHNVARPDQRLQTRRKLEPVHQISSRIKGLKLCDSPPEPKKRNVADPGPSVHFVNREEAAAPENKLMLAKATKPRVNDIHRRANQPPLANGYGYITGGAHLTAEGKKTNRTQSSRASPKLHSRECPMIEANDDKGVQGAPRPNIIANTNMINKTGPSCVAMDHDDDDGTGDYVEEAGTSSSDDDDSEDRFKALVEFSFKGTLTVSRARVHYRLIPEAIRKRAPKHLVDARIVACYVDSSSSSSVTIEGYRESEVQQSSQQPGVRRARFAGLESGGAQAGVTAGGDGERMAGEGDHVSYKGRAH
eukprot:CAMPEP_0170188052 /NCGR_PEP_ID=MMETSP0040_2-20121228/43325_1 /TAXON_ID=641309 /ORGANISM="Lotharella oceanica, Strain CCMP622" /LENGTH=307 /DNA_ID=CAMNT_0010435235 /DNA_START=1 /DNA_END=923 /DNA_ORIENTATION=+